ncbi:uncharacterized protein BO88DRAFT_421768 [Aspergillus vadensis CBS 113365]|uniref:Protein kinase domain-containing protein n=1 Tax=Aspergillus vadensis (strain CBS 113365 / IMI 142717 / IBT 24658) TaxID=1448311 RepID=A0A319CDI0_ASPVC|nr:hypothetical protein BO88DRAFT_421768 [Aspergillus vadensis CBS 113365]PYH73378.1 hypothetical protein BO88DRAFT_421768 [Aspergillus vadensis CBS 113365]
MANFMDNPILDLEPTNILLELENSNRTISHYLSEVPARTDSQRGVITPLREVIPTSLVSETRCPHIRLIDFGVDDHLARIIEILGQFPPQFIERRNRAAHFFDKQGRPTSLERLVIGTTIPFLKPINMPEGMLEIDIESRKPAAELLQHEWIRQ